MRQLTDNNVNDIRTANFELLQMRARRFHDARRTFISLVRADGFTARCRCGHFLRPVLRPLSEETQLCKPTLKLLLPKKGFEGGRAGRSSQVVAGKEPDSNESATPSTEHFRPSTETGVTLSQVAVSPPPDIDSSAVSALLSEALTAWLRAPDSAVLTSRLREVLRRLEGKDGG